MRAYLFFILIVLFLGCETASEIDIGIVDNKLDLRGKLHADSVIEVTLMSTRIATDNLIKPFVLNEEADVRLLEDGQFIERLTLLTRADDWQRESYYRSPSGLVPEPGKQYSVQITSPNYETVYAETIVPKEFSITDVKLVQQKTPITEGYFGLPVTVWFEDDPNQEDYFMLEAYSRDHWYDSNNVEITRDSYDFQWPITPRSYQGKGLGDDNPFELSIFFSDALLDGSEVKKYEFFVRVDKQSDGIFFGKNIYSDNSYVQQSFFARLKHITKAHYEYGRTSMAQLDRAEDPFAEPVFIRSNVEGGFGIFAAYTASDSEEIKE